VAPKSAALTGTGVAAFLGSFGPRGSPAAVLAGLDKHLAGIVAKPEFKKQVNNSALEPSYLDSAGFGKFLEADRASRGSAYWFRDRIGHADIAVAAVLRSLAEAHPGLIAIADYPALAAHSDRLEGMPVFQTIMQPFIPPA